MNSKRLYNSLNKLNFVRVSRTKEEKEAALIIEKEIEEVGGEVIVSEFDVSDWSVNKQKFHITTPIYKEYEVTAYGCSLNTNGPLTAPLYYFDCFTVLFVFCSAGTGLSYNIFKWYSIIADTIKLCKV